MSTDSDSTKTKLVTFVRLRDRELAGSPDALYRLAVAGATAPWPAITVNLCNVRFADVGLDEGGRASYDAVIERHGADPDAVASPLSDPAAAIEEQHTFLVEEHVIKASPARHARQPTPGIKCIYAVRRRHGLTREEYQQHWRLVHGDLAVRHHIGMNRYVQDHVRTATDAAPALDGIASLHFPSLRDRRERNIDSPLGRQIINADVAVFVGEVEAMATTEYVYTAR